MIHDWWFAINDDDWWLMFDNDDDMMITMIVLTIRIDDQMIMIRWWSWWHQEVKRVLKLRRMKKFLIKKRTNLLLLQLWLIAEIADQRTLIIQCPLEIKLKLFCLPFRLTTPKTKEIKYKSFKTKPEPLKDTWIAKRIMTQGAVQRKGQIIWGGGALEPVFKSFNKGLSRLEWRHGKMPRKKNYRDETAFYQS